MLFPGWITRMQVPHGDVITGKVPSVLLCHWRGVNYPPYLYFLKKRIFQVEFGSFLPL